MYSPRRSSSNSLSRSALVLSLENLLAGIRPLFAALPAIVKRSAKKQLLRRFARLGVTFLNIGKESGLNAKTIFGGEHKKTIFARNNCCGVAFYDYDHDGWLECFPGKRLAPGRFPKARNRTRICLKNNRTYV